MHILTTVVFVTLLSVLGESRTPHTEQNEDAFGMTNYGFACHGCYYPKRIIYAAAKHYCDITRSRPDLKFHNIKENLYRERLYVGVDGDVSTMLEPTYEIIPLMRGFSVYPFELDQWSRSTTVDGVTGPDRLVIDEKCNIIGAFTDYKDRGVSDESQIRVCNVATTPKIDDFYPLVSPPWSLETLRYRPHRSPERSPEHSPERSREQSPQLSPNRSPQRSREQSPVRSS